MSTRTTLLGASILTALAVTAGLSVTACSMKEPARFEAEEELAPAPVGTSVDGPAAIVTAQTTAVQATAAQTTATSDKSKATAQDALSASPGRGLALDDQREQRNETLSESPPTGAEYKDLAEAGADRQHAETRAAAADASVADEAKPALARRAKGDVAAMGNLGTLSTQTRGPAGATGVAAPMDGVSVGGLIGGEGSTASGLRALGYLGQGQGLGGGGAVTVPPSGTSSSLSLSTPAPDPDLDTVAATSGTETYTDYGSNPFTMVAKDHLSTFSIDVDTASYSIMRKKLEGGVLPPPEAVRAEEFINYLDYAYTGPSASSTAPFAVHMAAMPDPFRDGHHILRVGVKGKELSRDSRPPLHLTFLVDVSGSMSSPDKLPLAKQSLHMLVDNLREDDTVALATYAGRVAEILPPTSAGNTRQIHQAIESLNSGGSTAMSSGIDLAYQMAWGSFQPGAENRVVVLTDGDANVGRTSWDDMLSQVKGYADKGVTLSTIGFGMGNYQDTLMEQLSDNGDGNNYYVDGAQQAQRVFVDDLGGTLITIARDVKIQVDFNPDSVLAYRLIGYENRDIADRDFRNDKVDAGEVGAGHDVTALYDVILRDGYSTNLATVRMRWEKPGADVDQGGAAAQEKAYSFPDRALAERTDLASRDLRMAYVAGTYAEILHGSPQAQELSLDRLIAFAQQSQRPGQKDDVELIGLMKQARALGAGARGAAVSVR